MSRGEIVAESDLVSAVESSLKRNGAYSKLKAQLRAEVFHTLEDKTVDMPDKPKDILITSELIKEFLIKYKLDSTLSVFCEEIGQPIDMTVDREFIGGELGINVLGSDESVPLLVQLSTHLRKQKSQTIATLHDSLIAEDSYSDNIEE